MLIDGSIDSTPMTSIDFQHTSPEPRVLGVKQYPLTPLGVAIACVLATMLPPAVGWPVAVAIIWAWLVSPMPFLPIVPVAIRFRILGPIMPEAFFPREIDWRRRS